MGSERRAIVCQTETAYFVCPDNGILTHILRNEEHIHAVAVENSAYVLPQVSNTFHGRDIFAPVAAHLSRGIQIDKLGNPIAQPVQLPIPKPQVTDKAIIGQVIWIDSFREFGHRHFSRNLGVAGGDGTALLSMREVPRIDHLNRSYAESEVGEELAIVGSFNLLGNLN